jgi:S1-C subfamily serine protease
MNIKRIGSSFVGMALLASLCLGIQAPVGVNAKGLVAPRSQVSSLDDVHQAVVFIKAQGGFWDPATAAQVSGDWTGTGFIIDPSGIAVTNNHVVAGSAILEVYLDGEKEPRNAKVLGRSECSDLAVIDIDGEDFSYLEWYDGALKAGLPIFAVGFPLSNPELDMEDGIISKAKANGDTQWSFVKQVIEHSAATNPGNSGGPIVTQDGKVVGVHFAGLDRTRQYFAIARDEALPVIKQLTQERDVDTIGVNPLADIIELGGQTFGGIWVQAVQSGSPADDTEIKPGDLLVEMEGKSLAENGTMREFCSIIRSHRATDKLAITVLRPSTGELLEGQINGRPLKVTTMLPTTAEATPVPEASAATLEVINESNKTISGINIATPDATEWGDSVIGKPIAPGKSFVIEGVPAGTYDVRALDEEGNFLAAIYAVGLEGEQKWTVNPLWAGWPNNAKEFFKEDFTNNANKWPLGSNDNADYTLTDGQMSIAIKQENLLAWQTYQRQLAGQFLEEVVCRAESDDADCGIGVALDNNNLMWFRVNPAKQEYSLRLLEKGNWQDELVASNTSVYISPVGWNRYTVGRVGKDILLYVNGTLIDLVETNKIPRGKVIFGGASNATSDVQVKLDDLTVWTVR